MRGTLEKSGAKLQPLNWDISPDVIEAVSLRQENCCFGCLNLVFMIVSDWVLDLGTSARFNRTDRIYRDVFSLLLTGGTAEWADEGSICVERQIKREGVMGRAETGVTTQSLYIVLSISVYKMTLSRRLGR